jgi:hypothetical protein
MLRTVLYRTVYFWSLLQRSFAGVWQYVLSVGAAVSGWQVLSGTASVSAAVLCGWQCLHREPVCATWQHSLWYVVLCLR